MTTAVTPQFISQFIETQFPNIFREENEGLVEFIAAYYEWLEQTGQSTKVLRQLKTNRDIDTTVDDFIVHFKNTFFSDSRLQNAADTRFILKHITDLYQSKGSIRSIELLMKMMFGQEVEVFLPGANLLKPSDSKWIRPIYIELTDSVRNKNFVGTQVTGSTSGARGFVESIITKVVSQKRVTIAYLSQVQGVFLTGEFVSNDGLVEDAPKVTGSLSGITITNGGRNFAVGDLFNVISTTGRGAIAKITSVLDATGRVDFNLANGGYGYTVSNTYTRTLSSNATIEVSNYYNTNADIGSIKSTRYFNANTSVANTTDLITIEDHGFVNNDVLLYIVEQGNTAVNGLTNASSYFVVDANSSTFKLSSTFGGSAINLTAGATEEGHSLSTRIIDFFLFERVEQPISAVTYVSAGSNAEFANLANGQVVYGANLYPNNDVNDSNVASGYIVGGAANTFYIIVHSGDFASADTIYTGNVATNIQMDTVTDSTAYGEYIGTRTDLVNNTFTIGINANNKPFYTNVAGAFIYGLSSNTYANVVTVGTGTGADFEVGSLGTSETLTLFTDLIGANNTTGVDDGKPFVQVGIDASNSQIGFVDSVTIDTLLAIGAVSNTNYPYRANGNFANNQNVYVANLYINSVFMSSGGTGYTNGDTLTFTGGNPGTAATGTITTYANGTINFYSLTNGAGYRSQPAVSVSTSTGSGANLTAIMGAAGLGAQATIKQANATHFIINKIANGSFSTNDIITNEGVNAFANVTAVSLLSGGGYVSGDTITITGGSPNTTATATVTVNAASNGGTIHSITVDEPGTEYDSEASYTLNTSTGTGASLTVNMDYGYGFVKSQSADLTTVLYDAFTFSNFTIGTIASLKGINPGSGYNLDPVTIAHNPYIAGFNRRDIVCVVNDYTGVFKANERLQQNLSLPGYLVLHSNSTSNGITLNSNGDTIQIGEGVRQRTTNARGIISVSNSTHIKITSPIGVFDDSYVIDTLSTGAEITPLASGVSEEDTSAIATGDFKSIETDPLDPTKRLVYIRRLNFGQSFVAGSELTGQTSGATANVLYAYNDPNTLPIGLNAIVTANVITANGVADGIEIINSGYGYETGADLVLENANTPFIVAGDALVQRQGIGTGYWSTRNSFASDIAKIQDSDYWQEYSYVVRTGISLDKYRDILLDLVHVAGTKLFGEVEKVQEFTALRTGVTEYTPDGEEHPAGIRVQTQNAYSSWMG